MQTLSVRVPISILILLILTASAILPVSVVSLEKDAFGFSKGVSWASVVPTKKATFVGYDESSYVDDYSYLAAIPSSVFYDHQTEKAYSNPLLFFQDEYQSKNATERSLNARQGLDYFMEDWMGYCDGEMDKTTLINVPENKLNSNWDSRKYSQINSKDIVDVANQIALDEWSYSDEAVIAIVDEKEVETNYEQTGKIEGTLSPNDIIKKQFQVPQINIITPQFVDFTVPEGYKYLKARLWYPCFYFAVNLPGFFNAVNMTIPPGDPNLELFCKYKEEWMQVAATFGWNQKFGMDLDYTGSYIYENGPWRAAATDVPTHSLSSTDNNDNQEVHRHLSIFGFGRYGSFMDALTNIRDVHYNINVTMFPGEEYEIPDKPPYACKNASVTLTWENPTVNLGFSLIGPGGEEILTVANESKETSQEMHLDKLGQCLEDEHYRISVFSTDDIDTSVDFEVEYNWRQGKSEEHGESLTSASEGAILSSLLNNPMLYASSSEISEKTIDTLYKLGVKSIYIVDIGNRLDEDVLNEIRGIARVKNHFIELPDLYDVIRSVSNSNDVIFSTIDSWSYWYAGERKPAEEVSAGLFVGPASYLAAHHGSPLLIVENHPRLSSAVTWHTEFWRRNAIDPNAVNALPSVAEMYITGMRTYDFLQDYDFDQEQMESMITVAGQYDIGIPWDRAFFGRATPGRFFGSPVDTAYWISRNVFYPALVFVNPAMDENGIQLINGSASHRRSLLPWTKLGLAIDKPAEETSFQYPVLNSFLCYNHRFNERASEYWGWKYTCADGKIPGESPSFNAIDDGVCEKYYGKPGAFFPDFTATEVIPFYLNRAGFQSVYSVNFSAVMENLNRGVLLWMGSAHGGATDTGVLEFWNPDSPVVYEPNPWRGYEWYLGSTDEPDTLTMDNYGIIPMLFGNPTGKGLTGHGLIRTNFDYAPAKKPILDFIGKVASLPVIKHVAPEWLKNTQDYYDGIVGSIMFGILPSQKSFNGTQIDDSLGNIHSVGVINGACLISTKYLHLSLIRHGSVFQVLDPWPTSWYTTWTQFIPRNIALGDTIGEAFVKGISHVGILYISDPPQWWADIKQNVCFFGDPDLRPFVPNTEYSTDNYWDEEDTEPLRYDESALLDGHMPFGATRYPHKITPMPWTLIVVVIGSLVVLLAAVLIFRKQRPSS